MVNWSWSLLVFGFCTLFCDKAVTSEKKEVWKPSKRPTEYCCLLVFSTEPLEQKYMGKLVLYERAFVLS